MKQSAVCHSVAMALAAFALCATPGRADDTTQLALAPLPEVLSQRNVFHGKRAPMVNLRDHDKDGKDKKDCTDDWKQHRVRLIDHAIGYVQDTGWTLANLSPNHPAGFPADRYSYYLAPNLALGGGTELSFAFTGSEALGGPGNALFYGAGLKKRLMREGEGWLSPALAIGIQGNMGPDDHDTAAAFLAATKKVHGEPCEPKGIYLTAGAKVEYYDTDRNLANQTPRGRNVRPDESAGIRPYVGVNAALSDRIWLSGEVAKKMPWEFANPFAVRASIALWQDWGVTGGIRSVGYKTHGFIGLLLGSFGGFSRN